MIDTVIEVCVVVNFVLLVDFADLTDKVDAAATLQHLTDLREERMVSLDVRLS